MYLFFSTTLYRKTEQLQRRLSSKIRLPSLYAAIASGIFPSHHTLSQIIAPASSYSTALLIYSLPCCIAILDGLLWYPHVVPIWCPVRASEFNPVNSLFQTPHSSVHTLHSSTHRIVSALVSSCKDCHLSHFCGIPSRFSSLWNVHAFQHRFVKTLGHAPLIWFARIATFWTTTHYTEWFGSENGEDCACFKKASSMLRTASLSTSRETVSLGGRRSPCFVMHPFLVPRLLRKWREVWEKHSWALWLRWLGEWNRGTPKSIGITIHCLNRGNMKRIAID